MKILKNITSQLHTFVLWLLISAFFWGWIFTFVTDTSHERKVTVYCHVPEVQDVTLAVELERQMPEGLRMIKVHSFDYVMFDMESMELGDIFIIPASEIETYAEWLFPVGEEQGVKVYDAATGEGIATSYIRYAEEDFYLFLGTGSVHLEDGKALEVAMALLNLQ
ncbi:MAG: hypothetical protein J1E03_13190 [Acetatifactor sp.]|nr:hypothetical protein [Acetatifactor sp.]